MKLSKRVRQLECFKSAVGMIATEIRYFASPVEVIMRKLSGIDEYKELQVFALCPAYLQENRDFGKAWENALEQAGRSLMLNESDREVLLWFGGTLGTTDVDGQIANCARCREMLEQRLILARENKSKKGRMYSSLGILAGVFLVVLFI